MGVLAIHAGDLHVRAAYKAPLDAPAAVEDQGEPTRFVMPGIVTLDAGGPLFGYPALMACTLGRTDLVVWRYRRAGLRDQSVAARDAAGRGLTSETFLAFAAARLAWDAQAYGGAAPQVALVVPDDLAAEARQRLARALAADVADPPRLIGEDVALLCSDGAGPDGTWLVVSVDDDARRIRLVRKSGMACERRAADEAPEGGLAALRDRWLAAWNAQAAALVPGARAFEGPDHYDFERMWQELWDWIDADAAEPSRTLAWPLLRRSTVLTLCAHAPSLMNDLQAIAREAAARAASVRAAAGAPALAGVVVVAPAALRRCLVPAIAAELGLTPRACKGVGPDAYARGAAALAARGEGWADPGVQAAPCGIGVLGLGEDGAANLRPLFEAGRALPATARFTIVADRDAQKHVAVTLARLGGGEEWGQRLEFGPLTGTGVQRIGITVRWRGDGTLDASAEDRDTGAPVPCRESVELRSGVPLATARHLATF